MTDTVLEVSTFLEEETDNQPVHFVCCIVPNNFFGFTMTFCGLQIMCEGAAAKGEFSDCPQCVEVARRPGCPIGHDCDLGD